jgi:hypothetical protein
VRTPLLMVVHCVSAGEQAGHSARTKCLQCAAYNKPTVRDWECTPRRSICGATRAGVQALTVMS